MGGYLGMRPIRDDWCDGSALSDPRELRSRVPFHRLARSAALIALCSACSASGTGDGAAPPQPSSGSGGESSANASTTPPDGTAPSGSEIRGAAYRFQLPQDPAYTLFDEYVRAQDGQHGRRWRWSPSGEAPFCYVHAVEQPNYTAEFPQSSIDLFQARKSPNDTVLRNEVVDPPPAGAAAAVAQEMSSQMTLDDGTPVVLRGVIREQLTPGGTLLQLISSAPEELLQTCRIADIADSFAPTGGEAPTDPPQPAPPPGTSSSGASA